MSLNEFPDYKTVSTDLLIPYARNSRTHSKEQVAQIAASIKEFGFLNPIIIDGENGIIAGHGRVMAAQKLGIDKLPCIEAKHLTEAQKRAYVIADNKLAENAGWDDELLKVELSELQELGFDVTLTGFDLSEIEAMDVDQEAVDAYTTKIETPIYEITGKCPKVSDIFDDSKAMELIREIKESNAPDDVKEFLILAAYRHAIIRFDYAAEFYAHQNEEVQSLMENSALVIVDFDKAIENGYVQMNKSLLKLRGDYEE